jgi:adenylate cyclase class 2
MQSAEIELKIPVSSVSELSGKLAKLGFNLDTPRTLEQNTLYDTPARELKGRGQILRLRRYGARQVLTHKRHPDQEDLASHYKVRIETEADVSDADALAEIFTRLGYAPAFRYEKFRTEFSQAIGDAGLFGHLVIDETPIGDYAELEGPTDWIDRTLAALGVDPGVCLTQSYGKLFLEWKQRTGSPADHLTFEAIAQQELMVR